MHSTPAPRPLTLENCEAVRIRLGPLREVIVWRDGPRHLRPVERKRIRDLRPGDRVTYKGQPEIVYGIEPYR